MLEYYNNPALVLGAGSIPSQGANFKLVTNMEKLMMDGFARDIVLGTIYENGYEFWNDTKYECIQLGARLLLCGCDIVRGVINGETIETMFFRHENMVLFDAFTISEEEWDFLVKKWAEGFASRFGEVHVENVRRLVKANHHLCACIKIYIN